MSDAIQGTRRVGSPETARNAASGSLRSGPFSTARWLRRRSLLGRHEPAAILARAERWREDK
ncbi:MAG: hypothetical protein ACLPKB_27265 [Xanthobacteraceae bacterium]